MNMDMRLMQERFKQDPIYVEMFAKAGLGEPSNGGARKAIPEYLKTLTSRNAPIDMAHCQRLPNKANNFLTEKQVAVSAIPVRSLPMALPTTPE